LNPSPFPPLGTTSADAPEYPIACKRAKNITNSAQSPPQVVVVLTLDKSASTSASTLEKDAPPSPPASISSSEPIDDDVTTDVVNREMNDVRRVTDVTRRRHRGKTKLPAELNFNDDASLRRAPDASDDAIAIIPRPPPNVVTHRVRMFPLHESPRRIDPHMGGFVAHAVV
jgi:hypothetical protein